MPKIILWVLWATAIISILLANRVAVLNKEKENEIKQKQQIETQKKELELKHKEEVKQLEQEKQQLKNELDKAQALQRQKQVALQSPRSRFVLGRYTGPTIPIDQIKTTIISVFGTKAPQALAVAACESGYSMAAYGAEGEIGIFQFKPATFYGNGGKNIYDWQEQIQLTKIMWDKNQQHQWSCYSKVV